MRRLTIQFIVTMLLTAGVAGADTKSSIVDTPHNLSVSGKGEIR